VATARADRARAWTPDSILKTLGTLETPTSSLGREGALRVLRHLRNERHLLNVVTGSFEGLARSNPQEFAGRTFALNRLLVPPDEGLADVGAAFREAEAGSAAEPGPAPERSAADEFWSSYEARY
jgi:hypothetical protein